MRNNPNSPVLKRLFSSVSSPRPLSLYFLSLIQSVLKIAWDGHSWLGCGDLPSIAAVFFPKVGWTHGKSQQCPGTNLLFQRGSDWQTKKTSSFLSIKLVTIWAQSDAVQKINRYSPEKKNLFNGKRYLSLEQPRPGFDFRVYLCPLKEMSCMRGARTNFPKSAW